VTVNRRAALLVAALLRLGHHNDRWRGRWWWRSWARAPISDDDFGSWWWWWWWRFVALDIALYGTLADNRPMHDHLAALREGRLRAHQHAHHVSHADGTTLRLLLQLQYRPLFDFERALLLDSLKWGRGIGMELQASAQSDR